jgi:hypothetical protein
MEYIKGAAREQIVLFPEALDDYIAEENPVQFIEAFVNSLIINFAPYCSIALQPSQPLFRL